SRRTPRRPPDSRGVATSAGRAGAPRHLAPVTSPSPRFRAPLPSGRTGERREEQRRIADPSEDAALGREHLEHRLVEHREVRRDAVLEHEALVAAIVGLAYRRVHADLRRHAADDELADATV